MVCPSCYNNLYKLHNTAAGNALSPDQQAQVATLFDEHNDQKAVKDGQKKVHDETYNAADNRKRNLESQNARKKQRRVEAKQVRETGTKEECLAFAANNPTLVKKREKLEAKGLPPINIQAIVARQIYLLAAWVTDGYMNFEESLYSMDVKMEETASMASTMMDTKTIANNMNRFVCRPDYDCDASPRITTRITFSNRSFTEHKSETFLARFDCTDDDTIEHVMRLGAQGIACRKEIQALYKAMHGEECGIERRKRDAEHGAVENPPTDVVRDIIVSTMEEGDLRDLFLDILDNPNSDRKVFYRESILNGSFRFFSKSYSSFPFMDEIAKYQWSSSHTKSKGFDRALMDATIQAGVDELGLHRHDILAYFVAAWAGWDGSFQKNYFEVLVPDDAEILQYFRDIFKEIFGEDVTIHEYPKPSKFANGKDIVAMRMCSVKEVYSWLLYTSPSPRD